MQPLQPRLHLLLEGHGAVGTPWPWWSPHGLTRELQDARCPPLCSPQCPPGHHWPTLIPLGTSIHPDVPWPTCVTHCHSIFLYITLTSHGCPMFL